MTPEWSVVLLQGVLMVLEFTVQILITWAWTAATGEGLMFLGGEEAVRPRVPINAPLQPGKKPPDPEPPTKAEVMRAIPRSAWLVGSREALEFKAEKLTDEIGAPRFIPLIGPAQVRLTRWKCKVTFDLVIGTPGASGRWVTIPRQRETILEKTELFLVESEKR